MDSPMDIAKMALGNMGPQADDSGVGETLQEVSGSKGYLKHVLDQRRGRSEAPAETKDPNTERQASELKRLQDEFSAKLERMEQENRSLRDLSEKQLKTFEQIATRPQAPVTVQQQAAPEPLPTFEHEDDQLVAALNTLERRMDIKRQQERQQDRAYLNEQRVSMLNRDFKSALKRVKSQYTDWDNYFDEKQVLTDAANILNNPSIQSVDWDTELELAYNAKAGKDWYTELKELRKYKEDHEKKGTAAQSKQKNELHLVPTVGGRGGESNSGGLIADTILADARRAGKRTLTPKEFGKEWSRRRRVG